MKKILHIKSSVNGDKSFSVQLGNAIIKKIKNSIPDIVVVERNLSEQSFPHLTNEALQAFFTPEADLTENQLSLLKNSNQIIEEVLGADFIVIGAPLYNFGIPSQLKAWIDHLARAGVTFQYGEKGPVGLVTNKKVYIAMSSGGIYSEGPAKELDHVSPYLTKILGFLGMTDIEILRAEGTAMTNLKESVLRKALDKFQVEMVN